ncbi:TetR/AcrR family transcriptional regulator [Almyronema epifaneia]|uniref:TetR/AcrR family transcriptional regulator n=1 Tax=Almyronema epifaneia S1 TaxID=2991925 RepID=A0ABW6IFF4_9CYAN
MVTRDSDKREAILNAALELFAEYGFYGTPIPLIAERAHVGAGTIYRYFESKEALGNAVYQRAKEMLYDVLNQDFPEDLPVREQFHVFWQRITKFAIENPQTFQFLELHSHESYLDKTSRTVELKVWEPGLTFFEMTCQRKITKPLPLKILVAIVWGMFVGVTKAGQRGHYSLDEDLFNKVEQICWEAIRY